MSKGRNLLLAKYFVFAACLCAVVVTYLSLRLPKPRPPLLFAHRAMHPSVNEATSRKIGSKGGKLVQETQVRAVKNLAKRLFPMQHSLFHFELVALHDKSSKPFFAVRSSDSQVVIRGDSGVSLASGLNHYLTHVAHRSLSWTGENLLELPMPLPPYSVMRQREIGHGYYMNVCTLSYTAAFWQWEQWERELDWMALHGIDMPLVLTGREAVSSRLFSEVGVPEQQIRGFFTGPAFLAWNRMGNLRGWGGPLSSEFIERQRILTERILARARALGMRPVLPAFSGHVPEAIQRTQRGQNADVRRGDRWFGFSNRYSALWFVEPTDPLYEHLGKRFIEIQREMFGTDHLYAADQFNEQNPREATRDYVARAGGSQYRGMASGDPDAVWVLQGWAFIHARNFWKPELVEAYLDSVPRNRILVLDLISEASPAYTLTNNYEGRPFVWSLLHNFGGGGGMGGQIQAALDGPYNARRGRGANMVGVGLTMEGTRQNPLLYELTLESIWEPRPRRAQEAVIVWIRARYGVGHPMAESAWERISASVYSLPHPMWGQSKSILVKRPTIHPQNLINEGFQGSKLEYDPKALEAAWKLLIEAAETQEKNSDMKSLEKVKNLLRSNTNYCWDLVDVTRQVLSNALIGFYRDLSSAYAQRDAVGVTAATGTFLRACYWLELILRTNRHFMLGPWLRDAQALASAPGEADLFEYNARNLLTLWGPNGEISDYAGRLWAGLVKGYYRPRWELFLTRVLEAVESGGELDERKLGDDIRAFEQRWQHEHETGGYDAAKYEVEPVGDTVDVARLVLDWLSELRVGRV